MMPPLPSATNSAANAHAAPLANNGANSASPVKHSLNKEAAPDADLTPEQQELREAARAFEAIFVRRLLASARAGSFAEQTPFTGPGLRQFETMRDEQVAEIASNQGAFGLADQIEQQLSAALGQKGV